MKAKPLRFAVALWAVTNGLRELAMLTLEVAHPSSDDRVIAELGDAEWLA